MERGVSGAFSLGKFIDVCRILNAFHYPVDLDHRVGSLPRSTNNEHRSAKFTVVSHITVLLTRPRETFAPHSRLKKLCQLTPKNGSGIGLVNSAVM